MRRPSLTPSFGSVSVISESQHSGAVDTRPVVLCGVPGAGHSALQLELLGKHPTRWWPAETQMPLVIKPGSLISPCVSCQQVCRAADANRCRSAAQAVARAGPPA